MSQTFLTHRDSLLSGLLLYAIAGVAFAIAAIVTSPWSPGLALAGDTLVMMALYFLTGMARGARRIGELALRAAGYFLLLLAYTALAAVAIGFPLAWLQREGSLSAALGLSGATVLVLLALWRLWPAFGLVFIDRRRRWLNARAAPSVAASIRTAWDLTDANELFFSHGFGVTACIFVLAQGALALSGNGVPLPERYRWLFWAVYAAVLVPLTQWLMLRRCASAWLTALRRERGERTRAPAPLTDYTDAPLTETMELTASVGPDLDAMLLRSARAGQTHLALAALDRGADPNTVPPTDDRDQRSILVLAAVSPDMRLLRGLIAKGADLNREHAGLLPLIAATRDSLEGRPEAVMTLLTNGADPRRTDAGGDTPLHFAALSTRPMVAALLCDAGVVVDAVNRSGATPLGVACSAGNWELVQFLLERGARADVEQAQPALLAAAEVAEDEAHGVKLLLKRKARVDVRGALGRTALMAAALNGHAAIAAALLEAGATIDLSDSHGTTALMEAARAGALSVIDVLARHQPSPDLTDSGGRTALMIACQSTHASEEMVTRLLALGASPHIALGDDRRAVDLAAAAGRWSIVALLDPDYPRPADPAVGTRVDVQADAYSPAHLLDALRFGHWQIADEFCERVRDWPESERVRLSAELLTQAEGAPRYWLLNHGLDPNACDGEGTPLLTRALWQLPDALPAAIDLFRAGAQPGRGAIGDVAIAIGKSDQRRELLEKLALALIDRGADIFAPDAEGRTPLTLAVACGSLRLVETLLGRGVDPNARDRHGRTPLFAALALPARIASEMLKTLLRAGASPEARAANGETPLGLALARPDAELQRWLNWPAWKLPQRALSHEDFVSAAASGDVAAVEKFLPLGLPVNATDAQGATALLRAAGNGHAMMVSYLLDHGADAGRAAATGATALSAAASARRSEMVERLLAHGVAPDQRLKGGGTALMIAAALGYPEIVTLLLARGADVDAVDAGGTCALHAAAHFAFHAGDGERARGTLEPLLACTRAIDARNVEGQSALLLLLGARAEAGTAADQRILLALLPLLLARHPDLALQDQRGVSVLHACAMHGLLLPARALLAAGADPEARDMRERTPREVAHLLGFIDVAVELGASGPRRGTG
jgi:uncharacterized protein